MTKIITKIEQVRDFLPVPLTLNIDNISPFLDDVISKYILPYLGQDLIDILELEEYPEDRSANIEKLLIIVRKPLVRFAILLGTDQLDLKLTDSGFVVMHNQNLTPASSDRVSKFKTNIEQSAWDGIENLLRYLEKNEEDFPEWEEAEAHPNNWTTLIRSCNEFQKYVDIKHSRLTFFQYLNTIENIELLKIEPAISKALIDVIRNEIIANEISDKTKLILPYIKRALANFTAAEMMPESTMRFDNIANHFLTKVIQVMDANPENYPKYISSTSYSANKTSYNTYENTENKPLFVFGG
jgi:hypothetical protein